MTFELNNYIWNVKRVNSDSAMLLDRTGRRTVATTDPRTFTVYISKEIHGDFLVRVLIHELGHCAIVSFNLLDDIHRFTRPEHWIDAEEWICNFIADYGMYIYRSAYHILGEAVWYYIPKEMELYLCSKHSE